MVIFLWKSNLLEAFMKKLLKIIGIITVTGFVITACSNDSSGGDSKSGSSGNSESGKLTITNFKGNPALTDNYFIFGAGSIDGISFDLHFYANVQKKGVKVTGSSIILNVYIEVEGGNLESFTGNVTLPIADFAAGKGLFILANTTEDVLNEGGVFYQNKTVITFTNGSAVLNFAAQMIESPSQ